MTKQGEEEERHSPELKIGPTSISAKVIVVPREDNPNSLSARRKDKNVIGSPRISGDRLEFIIYMMNSELIIIVIWS
jgi:hypothetical protein